MQSFFFVGIAGAAGAVSRYGVGLLAERSLGSHFAFGTLLVNVLGCLALGFLLELDRGSTLVTHPVRMLLAVGFLGAFTTFSTFGYETLRYMQEGASHLALLNVSANLVLGLGGVWLGYISARLVLPGG
jgi:CrcB protein